MLESSGLRNLLSQKERELREVYDLNVSKLEQAVHEKDAEINQLKTRFQSLQDDFLYNLNLLEERDKELERFETSEDQFKTDVHDREARISELKIVIADKASEISNLRALVQAQEQHEIEAIRKLRREHELAVQSYENAQRARDDRSDEEKTELIMQLRTAAQDFDLLKQTHTADLDRIRRDHELDIRLIKQDSDQRLLDAEHGVATALGELSAAKMARDALEDKLQQQLEHNRNLDQRLRQSQWEMADLVKSHAVKVAELEVTLNQVLSKQEDDKRANEELRVRLQTESDRSQKNLEHEKIVLTDRLSHVTAKLNEAVSLNTANSSQSHSSITMLKATIEEQADRMQALDSEVAKLRLELKDSQASQQHHISRRDADLHHLTERLQRTEAENVELHQKINLYKQEISKRMEVEGALNRSMTEQNMEWERRYDELMRKRYWEQEDFIRSVVASKDRAEADLKLLRSRLDHADTQGLAAETDAWIQSMEGENQMLKGRIDELMIQNDQLATVVHQMKEDMASLYHNNSMAAHKPSEDELAPLHRLLAQKQALIDDLLEAQTRLHERTRASLVFKENVRPVLPDTQPSSTNKTPDALQHENAQLRAQLRSAASDLKKLAGERIKLMDMSNALRAELRMLRESATTDEDIEAVNNMNDAAVKTRTRSAVRVKPLGSSTKTGTKRVVVVTSTTPAATMNGSHNSRPAAAVIIGSAPISTRPGRTRIGESPMDPMEKESLRKADLRTRGIRNWNDKDDL
ncbi:hypothetical protein SmJEL517_g00132 [Synchytrium microbalum]|uniref:Uncharacterized protein n=1 Tax=Synchytrium microbalum TaxID=1806994 RepID=A0A507CGG5_9FUNG|nr:uncharacterized protein SmJEL517_g00132 [Synchytrium microbalum]TPX38309.1 hypothetical protein SmJEL517_g00132 [Synchytrium microbalum]